MVLAMSYKKNKIKKFTGLFAYGLVFQPWISLVPVHSIQDHCSICKLHPALYLHVNFTLLLKQNNAGVADTSPIWLPTGMISKSHGRIDLFYHGKKLDRKYRQDSYIDRSQGPDQKLWLYKRKDTYTHHLQNQTQCSCHIVEEAKKILQSVCPD